MAIRPERCWLNYKVAKKRFLNIEMTEIWHKKAIAQKIEKKTRKTKNYRQNYKR